MSQRPKGTVTFLFTDVEGSTQLLRQLRDRYGDVLEEHQRLLRAALATHGGEEIDTQGDAFFYVFSRAREAAAGAADGQRALAAHAWPEGTELRVRMGMHTGEPALSEEGRYHGMGVHRTARIMASGHGGQILLSQATASLLGDEDLEGITLHDLGEHKLKDLDRPERIYELQVDGLRSDFPPLKTEGEAARPIYRRRLVIGALAGAVAAAIVIPVLALDEGSGGGTLSALSGNSVGVVNPETGAIDDETSDVPTPTRIAASDDAIWVTSADTNSISRIDKSSHELRDTIRVGDGPTGIAFGAGDIWIANTLSGTVSRVDPEANEVVGDPIRVGNSPTAVAYGERSVWVTNVDDQTVSRINPKTGVVEKTIDVGAAGRGITVGDGAIWVGDSAENRVVRLDPKTNSVTQPIGVGSGPGALAFGRGAVWVANTLDGTVSRIDPATNHMTATVQVGASPNAIAASDDAVWVANEAGRTIMRLDPRTGNVVQTVRTGARPTGLALADSLWVAGQPSAGTHRGGTLLVDTFIRDTAIGAIDTAVAYGSAVWGVLSITNDGLVGFKRVGGGEGTQLVSNLATSLPASTDGGKAYTFRLRKGIRFSNGATLKASDVRATFERLFEAGSGGSYNYASIRGGSACAKQPKSCDLSAGIVTDDDAGTVAFHLTAPDAEFLYRLAIPFGSIVPAGTPTSKGGVRPVPATGPYVIQSATRKRFVLVRNRNFRPWTEDAKPQGYVDRIEVSIRPDAQRTLEDVARGEADVVGGFAASFGPRLAKFETEHPAQVHTTPTPTTFSWFLNASKPPFDDLRARRAVSYALDRAKLVQIHGGESGAQAICQVLPPNFPGYRPYCPFTSDPNVGGAWSAPDLAKARELVRQSGTAGAHVTFWGWRAMKGTQEIELARSVFTELGYRFSAKSVANEPANFNPLANASTNAGFWSWSAEYPAASNYFLSMTCEAERNGSFNVSHFCSPAFDRKLKRANALQQRDVGAAAGLWADIDREATDQVIWVPTVNPRNIELVSKRVGNYQHHPVWGVLLDQLWIR